VAYILSLDTSTKVCSVAIHDNGQLIGSQEYYLQKSHSSLLPSIIKELIENIGINLQDVQAIALAAGPGSYTGLRIGTATVKGLCFALNIPLIALDTLDSLTEQVSWIRQVGEYVLCPMLDARRMEVYCKLISADGDILWNTNPVVVDTTTFVEYKNKHLLLYGNGAEKLASIMEKYSCTILQNIHPSASFMGRIAFNKFRKKDFEDLAYFEPDYLKEFQTKPSSKKLL